MNEYLEKYIEMLLYKQNLNVYAKNLYTKEQYYKMLKPVVDLLSLKPDLSLNEYRDILFEQAKIREKLINFIYEKRSSAGLVLSYGTNNYLETLVAGNRQEVEMNTNGEFISNIEPMNNDTIFDLASVTKLFTSLSILQLVENKRLSLNMEVKNIVPEFKNLTGVTIKDLLSFQIPLKTAVRLDTAKNQEEALEILYSIEIDSNSTSKNPYTDMGAMVLKYVIEKVSGISYYQYLQENILKSANMVDTHVNIPNSKLNRVVNTNYAYQYLKDNNFSINTSITKGLVYDAKARIMGQNTGNLSGHAGLFSTAKDMTNLAKNIINGEVISSKYLTMLAKNRTGKKYIDSNTLMEKYIQSYGFLCYSKNPRNIDSEVHHALSGVSFASAGWTGTKLAIDPLNEIYLFMAGNRSHNRLTFIDVAHKNEVIITENGTKTIKLPNDEIKIDATRFAYDKGEVVEPTTELVMQYKFLEDIIKIANEPLISEERIRRI